ncbi:MAG: hypothetical protein Q7R52_03855 [archaeon]|nr:hypothetical protein [archaeon]
MGLRDCVEKMLYHAFLEKVNEGIIVNSPNGHRLAVAMHPYFKPDKQFEHRMNQFLRDYEGSVLIFEEIINIKQTYALINNLRVKGNRHFVMTGISTPYPYAADYSPIPSNDWENILKNVNKLRNEQPVDLTGGYFFSRNIGKPPKEWRGCLGVFASMLIENKVPINFLDDLVF